MMTKDESVSRIPVHAARYHSDKPQVSGGSRGVSLITPILYKRCDIADSWRSTSSVALFHNGMRFQAIEKRGLKVGATLLVRFCLPKSREPLVVEAVVRHLDYSKSHVIVDFEGFDKTGTDGIQSKVIRYLAEQTWNSAISIEDEGLDITTRMASTRDDYISAANLLYKEYNQRGYCKTNDNALHFSYFAALPDSRTFLVFDKERLFGTFSLISDSVFGLPVESIYANLIAGLRLNNRKLAELSLLSLDCDYFGGRKSYLLTNPFKLYTFVRLVRSMIDHACQNGITDLLVAVHPKNRPTYEFLLFRQVGKLRRYETVGGNPAILLHVDMHKVRKTHRLERFVSIPSMSAGVAAYLYYSRHNCLRGLDKSVVVKLLDHQRRTMPRKVSDYLQFCYPGYTLGHEEGIQ